MLPNILQPNETDHVPVLAEEVRELLAIEPVELDQDSLAVLVEERDQRLALIPVRRGVAARVWDGQGVTHRSMVAVAAGSPSTLGGHGGTGDTRTGGQSPGSRSAGPPLTWTPNAHTSLSSTLRSTTPLSGMTRGAPRP